MLYFLYGPDSYRSRQKLNEIISHYKEVRKSGLNLIYLDAQEKDFDDFYNTFNISPIFAENKLIILRNVFLNKKFQEEFLEHIETLESLKDIIVIYEGNEVDQRVKLFKTLTKAAKSQEFVLLDAKNVRNWAQKEFERYQQKIYPVKSVSQSETVSRDTRQFNRINLDALTLLLLYVGNDLWSLSGEIKKLVDFKNGAIIKKEDVELLVKPSLESDIFKTIDSIADQNRRQALILLHKHIDGGDDPIYLLSMITYQFRNLLIVKELAEKGLMYNSIVKKSGLHPFVVKKNYFQCNRFSFATLRAIYQNMFQIDLDVKTGKIEPEAALDLLVSRL